MSEVWRSGLRLGDDGAYRGMAGAVAIIRLDDNRWHAFVLGEPIEQAFSTLKNAAAAARRALSRMRALGNAPAA